MELAPNETFGVGGRPPSPLQERQAERGRAEFPRNHEPFGGSRPTAQQCAAAPNLTECRDGHRPDWTLDGVSTDERATAGARLGQEPVQKTPEPLGRSGPGQGEG
jgi:hypothetical protein